ncbi:hypothetical protein GCM10020367_56200 [Streptomyces sannanensis]|uniref:Class F sortase n=1 Tax=Streptomyces sannanensis TaxID=285536 RepID=A0ABP6SJJ8_9ACTN
MRRKPWYAGGSRSYRFTRTVCVALSLAAAGVWWTHREETERPAAAVSVPAAPGSSGRSEPATEQPAPVTEQSASATEQPVPATEQPVPAGAQSAELPPSPATGVIIPALEIAAPTVGVGLDASGRLGTPPVDNPNLVGWYRDGPTPGTVGTAVVAGHRDTRSGPAVFLNLAALKQGDVIDVARADGRTAVYTVDSVRTYAKSEFPDMEVYGQTGRAELRLLTCGGSYNRTGGYASNVVVFAHFTAVKES